MFFIILGVVLFSMCYFILQEEISVKAFKASNKAQMSIIKCSYSIKHYKKNSKIRRNLLLSDSLTYSDINQERLKRMNTFSNNSLNKNTFNKLKKRRQSALAV